MFRKDIEPDCRWCRYGYVTVEEDVCLCDKCGVISRPTGCRKFVYDPLKRIPQPKKVPESVFSAEDFSIE